jgi:hypothetical protein
MQPHWFGVPPPPQEAPVAVQAAPQERTEREVPQLSVAVKEPQLALLAAQSAASLSGVQPHWLAAPAPPQDTPVPLHEPQEATLRWVPQLSAAVSEPQLALLAAQKLAVLSGVQPHWLALPAPPQVAPVAVQAPQEAMKREAPQLSVAVKEPQAAPLAVQTAASLSDWQPHWLGVPAPPQDAPVPLQVPQDATVRLAPQLSLAVKEPQAASCVAHKAASLSATQPHWLAVPAPPQDTSVPLQVPQEATVREVPQLSVAVREPQLAPLAAQTEESLSGAQPHWLATPPPPQVSPAALQVPQEATVRAVPQLSVAVKAPQTAPLAVQSAASLSGEQLSLELQPSPAHNSPTRMIRCTRMVGSFWEFATRVSTPGRVHRTKESRPEVAALRSSLRQHLALGLACQRDQRNPEQERDRGQGDRRAQRAHLQDQRAEHEVDPRADEAAHRGAEGERGGAHPGLELLGEPEAEEREVAPAEA